jgi:hypothetical protein
MVVAFTAAVLSEVRGAAGHIVRARSSAWPGLFAWLIAVSAQ